MMTDKAHLIILMEFNKILLQTHKTVTTLDHAATFSSPPSFNFQGQAAVQHSSDSEEWRKEWQRCLNLNKKHHSSELLICFWYKAHITSHRASNMLHYNTCLQTNSMWGWQKRKNSKCDSILAERTACFRHLDTKFSKFEGWKLVT